MKSAAKLYILFVVLLAFWACGGDTISSTDDIHFPDENVSYTRHVEPLLKYTCAYAGCHNRFDQAAGLALDNYFDLTIAMSSAMVRPNDPDKSILIQVFERKFPHTPVYWSANESHIKGLRKWIQEGAKNN